MQFSNFYPDCVKYVLQREMKELPAERIAAIAIDEGLYESDASTRDAKIYSLQSTVNSRVKDRRRIIYRTEKRPHPETRRMVYHFGLSEWKKRTNGQRRDDLTAEAKSRDEVAVSLGSELQDSVKILMDSGKARTEGEAVAWLAEQGQEARKEYLGELRRVLEQMRKVRDSVG
jgi:hypothetical protein